jgi:hypothetical protein
MVAFGPVVFGCSGDKGGEKPTGWDSRIYKEIWPLLKAVEKQDTRKIETLVADHPSWLNYQEPNYGQPLLSWAVMMSKYDSAEKLLALGAAPNLQDDYNGTSPMMQAAAVEKDPRFIHLLLRYGGDVRALAKPKDPTRIPRYPSVLFAAVNSLNLENVKLIVEAGADINYRNPKACSSFTAKEWERIMTHPDPNFKAPPYQGPCDSVPSS